MSDFALSISDGSAAFWLVGACLAGYMALEALQAFRKKKED